MKYRLTEQGWESYTGQMGVVDFADGVSIDDVSYVEAQRLAAILRIETVEVEPKDPGAAAAIVASHAHKFANHTVPAQIDMPKTVNDGKVYTLAELEAAADAGGIKAIRAIADPYGLKGTSIADLVKSILTSQTSVGATAPETAE